MSDADINTALENGKAVPCEFGELSYIRFVDSWGGIPRGTARFGADLVYGYPRIGRLMALEPGVREQFSSPFWVEEKIDGYNVRIFRHGRRLLALTRGGFVCPFSTDRVADLMDTGIFEQESDLVVCAEIAGPDNPYMEGAPPFISEDVRLFVFDMARWNRPGFLPQDEKCALAGRHGLALAEGFGRFGAGDIEALHVVVLRLDREGREGIVLKEDSVRDHRAKYVTRSANIADIHSAAPNLLEQPADYFTARVLRLVLFMQEQGVAHSAGLDRDLGAAFLDGLMEAIEQYRRRGKVSRVFHCRFRRRENAVHLLEHLSRVSHQVQISLHDLYPEDGYWHLEFDRTYPTLNGLLSHLLGGGMLVD